MNYCKSIRFTQKNHDEIAELLDYDYIYNTQEEKTLNKTLENLRRFLVDNEAPRYLYAIRCGSTKQYKIGITNDIGKRIKTLQTGNPYRLKLIFLVEADLTDYLGLEIRYLENFLHQNYKHLNVNGEWYKFTQSHLSDICFFLVDERDLELTHEDPEELNIYKKRVNKSLMEQGLIDEYGNDID